MCRRDACEAEVAFVLTCRLSASRGVLCINVRGSGSWEVCTCITDGSGRGPCMGVLQHDRHRPPTHGHRKGVREATDEMAEPAVW